MLSAIVAAPQSATPALIPVSRPNGPSRCGVTLDTVETAQMIQAMRENEALHFVTPNLSLTAHRGGGPTSLFGPTFPASYRAENSLDAIRQAFVDGADTVEIDIFLTSDGEVLVTHDDEIWKNRYADMRDGSQLPPAETRASYRVSEKTLAQMQQIDIGPNGETMPTLRDVMTLLVNVNRIRDQADCRRAYLNVEIKNSMAVDATLQLMRDEFPGIANQLMFCSFDHEALGSLVARARQMGLGHVNAAPGITTKAIFGAENVNPDYSVKKGAQYPEEKLAAIRKTVSDKDFAGFDAILWDIRPRLVDAAKQDGKQLHASTSDFRQYDIVPDFASILLEIAKAVPTFFKCDDVRNARTMLLQSAALANGPGAQLLAKRLPDGDCAVFVFHPNGVRDDAALLEAGRDKPMQFTKWVAVA